MIICRAILKAKFAGTVETRNMFVAQFPLATSMDADIQAAMITWVTSVYASVLSGITELWVPYSVQMQEYVTGSWNDIAEIPYSGPGANANDFESFQTAVLFVAHTAGLKVVGKKFIAGIGKNATVAGSITAGALVYWATALAAYVTPFVSGAGKVGTPGVVSKSGVFWGFIGGTVGSILSTMRRRKPGYGI